ncbi:MAG: hypothetical protein EPN75_01155 [Beijerinckiaceae bacterium]|nr:MAG: hypothetical protein EPN75_01155 [Beijerinckiaceae bacterium]
MKLGEAEIHSSTGFAIGNGSLTIGSEADMRALGIVPHNHVLLSPLSNGTTIWPVTSIVRNAHGFCEATLAEIGLALRPSSLEDIAAMAPHTGRVSLTRGGSGAGGLRRCIKSGNKWVEQRYTQIDYYELGSEYGPEGLHIVGSGQVHVADDQTVRPFSVDATISWATLAVKGSRYSGAYWKFGHPQGLSSTSDSSDRRRDPKKLTDLLIPAGLSWPYLKGCISFIPELAWVRNPSHDFVSILFDCDQIMFSDAPGLEVLDTGFARNRARQRHVNLIMFDRKWLEKMLRQRDEFSIELSGSAIGSVRYQLANKDFRDPLSRITQPIKTMALCMALESEGLRISAEGELDDFDQAEMAKHREKGDWELKPVRAYSMQATLPWALLIAREFSFADRAKNF